MDKQHQIILAGTTADEISVEQAAEVLGKLFKREPERLRPLFAGKPYTVPMKLTEEQARKLHLYLTKSGIPCSIKAPEPALVTTAFNLEIDESHDEPATTSEGESGSVAFACPKCGTGQEREESCIECGLVFEKYYAQQLEYASEMGDVEDQGNPGEDDLLDYFVDTNMHAYQRKFEALENGARATWHWPAFFVPFYWALYRKMWFISVAAFITQLFWPISNIVFGLVGNQLYYQHAKSNIDQLSKKFRGHLLLEKLEARGGTSSRAVIIAIVLTLLLNVLVFRIFFDTVQTIVESPEVAEQMSNADQGIVFMNDGKARAKPSLASQKEALITSLRMATISMQYAMHSRIRTLSRDELESKLQLSKKQNRDGWGNVIRLQEAEKGYVLISAGVDGVFDSGDEILFRLGPVSSSL